MWQLDWNNLIKSLEQILSNQELLMIARQKYLRNLADHSNEESIYICDKMPHNYVLIGLIKFLFPEAKVINCYRNPQDNCFSIYKNLFDYEGAWCYDENELVQYYKLYQDHTRLFLFLSLMKTEVLFARTQNFQTIFIWSLPNK